MVKNDKKAAGLLKAIRTDQPVAGYTHTFYRYPARFSPLFPRAAIEAFTRPGDVIVDPFMGGGTTLVEGLAQGRRVIGGDISELAVFVSRVKTTVMSDSDLAAVQSWAESVCSGLNLHNASARPTEWVENGYHRNISGRKTWAIRKLLQLSLQHVAEMRHKRLQHFARCALLNVGQWALDCRSKIPSASKFRTRFIQAVDAMSTGAREFRRAVARGKRGLPPRSVGAHILSCSASSLSEYAPSGLPKARLLVTSPPYPGVYVLYHRWKVMGRKESPAPFWLAGCQDGHGHNHYLMGKIKEEKQQTYFENIRSVSRGSPDALSSEISGGAPRGVPGAPQRAFLSLQEPERLKQGTGARRLNGPVSTG